jgi:hypothetical protein
MGLLGIVLKEAPQSQASTVLCFVAIMVEELFKLFKALAEMLAHLSNATQELVPKPWFVAFHVRFVPAAQGIVVVKLAILSGVLAFILFRPDVIPTFKSERLTKVPHATGRADHLSVKW